MLTVLTFSPTEKKRTTFSLILLRKKKTNTLSKADKLSYEVVLYSDRKPALPHRLALMKAQVTWSPWTMNTI